MIKNAAGLKACGTPPPDTEGSRQYGKLDCTEYHGDWLWRHLGRDPHGGGNGGRAGLLGCAQSPPDVAGALPPHAAVARPLRPMRRRYAPVQAIWGAGASPRAYGVLDAADVQRRPAPLCRRARVCAVLGDGGAPHRAATRFVRMRMCGRRGGGRLRIRERRAPSGRICCAAGFPRACLPARAAAAQCVATLYAPGRLPGWLRCCVQARHALWRKGGSCTDHGSAARLTCAQSACQARCTGAVSCIFPSARDVGHALAACRRAAGICVLANAQAEGVFCVNGSKTRKIGIFQELSFHFAACAVE